MSEKSIYGQTFVIELVGNRVIMTMNLEDDYNAIGFYETVLKSLHEEGSVILDMTVKDQK